MNEDQLTADRDSRKKRFEAKVEESPSPTFENEKVLCISYDGKQWEKIGLAKHEAEIVIRELKKAFESEYKKDQLKDVISKAEKNELTVICKFCKNEQNVKGLKIFETSEILHTHELVLRFECSICGESTMSIVKTT